MVAVLLDFDLYTGGCIIIACAGVQITASKHAYACSSDNRTFQEPLLIYYFGIFKNQH